MATVFRWNITRREQLGRLVEGEPAESYPEFLEDLRRCCARVIAMAGDSRLVFVGRSPESLYDYLTGALADTSWADRLAMLNVSLWAFGRFDDTSPTAAGCDAMRAQLADVGLAPARIAASPRPIALIDLVSSGGTLGTLVELLISEAERAGVDVRAVRRRLRIVGISQQETPHPRTWRWRTHTQLAVAFRPSAVKGVSIPPQLWDFLGNTQKKVARTNPPARWGDPQMARPPRGSDFAAALRFAVALHDLGRTRAERDALAAQIATQPAMRYPWCRVLGAELRGTTRLKRVGPTFASKRFIRPARQSRSVPK
ncbi:MAG TPA: hypothetical protein VFZ21_32815 [Gemmatimonadaceae bacterium]|jgi:hypothetical protein|nr:hypothetical protein [Gemmatimonadaceae bacterium]